jgi:hypothetical protein
MNSNHELRLLVQQVMPSPKFDQKTVFTQILFSDVLIDIIVTIFVYYLDIFQIPSSDMQINFLQLTSVIT